MDETKLKIRGRQVFVRGAIDVDTKELLAVYASYYRSHINILVFLRKVLGACTNKPLVLEDGGRGIRGLSTGWGSGCST